MPEPGDSLGQQAFSAAAYAHDQDPFRDRHSGVDRLLVEQVLALFRPLLYVLQAADYAGIELERDEFQEPRFFREYPFFGEYFIQNLVAGGARAENAEDEMVDFRHGQAAQGQDDLRPDLVGQRRGGEFPFHLRHPRRQFFGRRRVQFHREQFLFQGFGHVGDRRDEHDGRLVAAGQGKVGFAQPADHPRVRQEVRKVFHHAEAAPGVGDELLQRRRGVARIHAFHGRLQAADAAPGGKRAAGEAVRRQRGEPRDGALFLGGVQVDQRIAALHGAYDLVFKFGCYHLWLRRNKKRLSGIAPRPGLAGSCAGELSVLNYDTNFLNRGFGPYLAGRTSFSISSLTRSSAARLSAPAGASAACI